MTYINVAEFSNIQFSLLPHSTQYMSTRSGSLLNYENDLSNFTKKVQMKDIFHDTKYEHESIVSNKSTKNFETKSR